MNDRELADKIVACGVGRIVGYDDRGQERVVLYRVDREVGTPPDKFVRDWRVAGAMMEKCPAIDIDTIGSPWWVCALRHGKPEKWFKVTSESLPRALIEACAEALDGESQ